MPGSHVRKFSSALYTHNLCPCRKARDHFHIYIKQQSRNIITYDQVEYSYVCNSINPERFLNDVRIYFLHIQEPTERNGLTFLI